MYPVNHNQKEIILISVEADFRIRKIIRDKEGHYIMTKWSIVQEYIKILTTEC